MIVRACSYNATIQTPDDPNNYSQIKVTFAQEGNIVVEKNKSALTIDSTEGTVTVHLTQAETKLFDAAKMALMQIRCFASANDAPGSCVFGIPVCPALNDEVLS